MAQVDCLFLRAALILRGGIAAAWVVGGGEGAYMACTENCRCTVVQRLALSSGSVLSEVYDRERRMDPLFSLDITS